MTNVRDQSKCAELRCNGEAGISGQLRASRPARSPLACSAKTSSMARPPTQDVASRAIAALRGGPKPQRSNEARSGCFGIPLANLHRPPLRWFIATTALATPYGQRRADSGSSCDLVLPTFRFAVQGIQMRIRLPHRVRELLEAGIQGNSPARCARGGGAAVSSLRPMSGCLPATPRGRTAKLERHPTPTRGHRTRQAAEGLLRRSRLHTLRCRLRIGGVRCLQQRRRLSIAVRLLAK